MAKREKVYLTAYPHLMSEWHPEKNGDLDPTKITHGSKKKVWWKCSAQGHTWEAVVYSRALNGAGCPVCSGQKVLPGFNDLATTHPELMAEWSPRNEFGPESVSEGSTKRVRWECAAEHTWEAVVNNRALSGKGCPVCSGTKVLPGFNDLATTHSELVAEWSGRNAFGPETVTAGSGKRAIWECAAEHTWAARVSHRTGLGSGCPYCSGSRAITGETDLASQRPDLAAEWSPENDRAPDEVTVSSGYKASWVCADHGHAWVATVCTRSKGHGCPVCVNQKIIPGFNDLASAHPELVEEWSPKNGDLTPETVSVGSGKKVWWMCRSGHEWAVAPGVRTGHGSGCPKCCFRQTSKIEGELFQLLVENFPDAEHGERIGRYSVDALLVKQRVIIEYDGSYFHKDRAVQDTRKTSDLIKWNYRVVRVRESTSQWSLPELEIVDPNYLELTYDYSPTWDGLSEIVAQITEWALND